MNAILKRKFLPTELIFELINFLPPKRRWATIRVSAKFDNFVLRRQADWHTMCLFIAGQFDAAVEHLMKYVFRVSGVLLFHDIRAILRYIKRQPATYVTAREIERASSSYNFELYRKDMAIIRDMLLDDIELFQSVPQYLYRLCEFYEVDDEWTRKLWVK